MAAECSQNNLLKKRIDEAIQKNGYDENFIAAVKMHLNVYKTYLCDKDKINNKIELCEVLLSKLFIDNMENIYPSKRFTCQLDENFVWDFDIFPSEVFAEEKFPENFRKLRFNESLKAADVLDCKVDLVLTSEYQLQIVHKYGCARLIYDLNMMVFLPRNPLEISLLRKELSKGELIRVAVLSNESVGRKKITVTLDENTLQFSKKYITLGRIKESDLPLYLRRETSTYSGCKTLTDYLNMRPEFKNPLSLNSILRGFGVDDKKMYSFYPNIASMKCPDEFTGQSLLKAAKAKDLENFLNLAEMEQKCGNVPKTLDAIEVALELDDKCAKAYEIRGSMYAKLDNKCLSKKALLDFEMALKLDPGNLISRQYVSRSLFNSALKFFKSKDYENAFNVTQEALECDKDNEKASTFLIKFKASSKMSKINLLKNAQVGKENPSGVVLKPIENPFAATLIKQEKTFENIFEEDTLTALQKKKRDLVSELNMITIDD